MVIVGTLIKRLDDYFFLFVLLKKLYLKISMGNCHPLVGKLNLGYSFSFEKFQMVLATLKGSILL
jgi:hypothetical protein